ncbi:MAG: DEAD/DEAH box helicase family protein [Spirochaetota bacterium]
MSQTYFQKHEKDLKKVITRYRKDREEDQYKFNFEYSLLDKIEHDVMAKPLRYYQMEALYILDYLTSASVDKDLKKELLETLEGSHKIPFLGFEMATGSGKTLLMGAAMYYLNQRHGIQNFLIITPASTDIYQKSVRNFSLKTKDSVWSRDFPLDFNLVTGDNYAENQIGFDTERPMNIFVFNIAKFGKNAVNTMKRWESSVWKDEKGNVIAIRDYLQKNRLAIITDESHHAQSTTANQIIKSFAPHLVLEFTATALEEGARGEAKRAQKIVYKYDIRRFLEDGHGKLTRAVALKNEGAPKSKAKNVLPENEKLKIITVLLIHLLKSKAMAAAPAKEWVKPLCLVKVKDDTPFAELVFQYIQTGVAADAENLDFILSKITEDDLDITRELRILLDEHYPKPKQLQQAFAELGLKTIFYHGKSDKETERRFQTIQEKNNPTEVVVYMQRLDEGIDIAGIYSIAVVHDSESDFKTSVKQIIGRGVRLNKEKRIYDEQEDDLIGQTEKLHIVCDRGKNFENVILSIQQEFGLNDKYLSYNKKTEKVINSPKTELLKGKTIPRMKLEFRKRPNQELLPLIQDYDKIIAEYLKHNTFENPDDASKRMLRYQPESFFTEIDFFGDEKELHRQILNKGGQPRPLASGIHQAKQMYGMVLKRLHVLPDSTVIQNSFEEYTRRLRDSGLQYYHAEPVDEKISGNTLVQTFAHFYRHYVEKHYFYLPDPQPPEEGDEWRLDKAFEPYEISLNSGEADQEKFLKKLKPDRDKYIELIQRGFHFKGFANSIYSYVRFDSYTEKQLVDYFEHVIANEGQVGKDFWVRNERQIYFIYGGHRYYPDFFLFHKGKLYVVEAKGEAFSNKHKNKLLRTLDSLDGYGGLLIFSEQAEELEEKHPPFARLLEMAQASGERQKAREIIVQSVLEEEKFVKFLPIYSFKAAAGKFSEGQEVKEEGWVEVPETGKRYPESYYVVQIMGESMEPEIPNHSLCIFEANPQGSRNGLIVLAKSRYIDDPETQGHFTVKYYRSEKNQTADGNLFNERIILSPANRSGEFVDIVIKPHDEQDFDFAVIGVFKRIISTP